MDTERAFRVAFLRCVIAGALVNANSVAAQVEPDEDLLVLRIAPRNYHLDQTDPTYLSSLLAYSLTKPIAVKAGQTLSGILQEQFNVTETWTPLAYKRFASKVQMVNGIRDPKRDLIAGQTLLLPDMPRGAETPNVIGGLTTTRAQVTFGTVGVDSYLADAPKMLNRVSALSATEIQLRSMKRSQYAALNIDPLSTRSQMLAFGQPLPIQGEIVANMAVSDATVGAVDEPSKALITKLLQAPAKTHPYVVILDDSWPSQDDFHRSVRFILDAAAKVREAYFLQDSRGDSSDVKSLKDELDKNHYGTTFCESDCEYPLLKSHSAMIRRSLDGFSQLDTQERVGVFYIPLNVAQRYARNALGEIMRVALLADSVSSQLVLKTSLGNLPKATQPGIPNFDSVDKLVDTLLSPVRLSAVPPAYTPGADLRVSTDKSIVDAVVNFMVLYSAASQRPHFISMSWTSPRNSLPATFRDDAAYGLWIAAAGNDPNANVQLQLPLFAGRSTVPGDFIAVQNTSAAGCDTSKLSANKNLHVYGLAFPGRIDADHCGTSFSAPRVAWLLALREAAKGTPATPSADEAWTQWKAAQMEAIFRLSRPDLTGEDRYRVSVQQLLDETDTH
ncbi:S8 family serine peptidase [Rhodoferax sp. GW822-FHT02A01]|uniref:S8 family serine peptidase n=1 Tax=Rhodoferax sp. GW822-FHT02A01 TaxID=3141537 RepID=UPI00315D92E3